MAENLETTQILLIEEKLRRINKLWNIYTMKNYPLLKIDELLCETIQMKRQKHEENVE